MKSLAIIFLIALLLITACATQTEAESKSFTIRVSCIVPERLELTTPAEVALEQGHIAYQKNEPAPSKVQTQETKVIDGQETLIYTVVER